MNSCSDPFQDPSMLRAQSSDTKVINLMAPPPVSSVDSVPSLYQIPPSSSSSFAPMTTNPSHSNLMDEISDQIKTTNSQQIIKFMRILNLVLASATITVGVLAWLLGQVNTFHKAIAGIYIILFGILLLAFELRTDKTDVVLRTNFGFMYGNKTRTVFLVFIAIWPLSMGNFWLTILDAVLLFVNAFFNYFVISQHPAFSTMPPVQDVNQPQTYQPTSNIPPSAHANV
ncbi:unnamed protein product [Peronospora belbahrii]|uniref:Golgi apparatus membrane protein TVP15 n=1 Tax=Peronospora belbahrii TaxID=622444 RepID=A0AAU9LET7_9STRA|nr:unnamed protein product [Peronospora belbahrii]CAH0521050.1 unnamed protein product [Peronospora belbahrii]